MAKGSVRKKGKKWYYRFYVEDASGNSVQREFPGSESKIETEAMLRKAMADYEEKQFVQYFMPYRELGVVKEASKDLLLNINKVAGADKVEFKVMATSKQEVRIELVTDDGTTLYDKQQTLSPEMVLTESVDVKGTAFENLNLRIYKTLYGEERVVLQWHAESDEIRPIPDSAEAALPVELVKTNEQLFLTGRHLEQYRHATWSPVDYYEEALERLTGKRVCEKLIYSFALSSEITLDKTAR